MRTRYLILFLMVTGAIITPSHSQDCFCPPTHYQYTFSTSVYGNYSEQYVIDNPIAEACPTSTSGSNIYVNGDKYELNPNNLPYSWHRYETLQCRPNPVCTSPQINNVNSSQHECIDPPELPDPEPECPAGQQNATPNSETLNCECIQGYPIYEPFEDDIKECVLPKCLPESPDNGYPLKYENIDYETCDNLFNAVLGYSTEFIEVPDLGITCCYSDTTKEDNDTCPPNHLEDVNGDCQEIQSAPNDCPAGSYYSYSERSCVPLDAPSEDTSDQGGNNDGLNSDGTVRESGSGTSYSGGGSESNTSEKVLLEYNEDEVNNMLDGFKGNIEKSFTDFIVDNTGELLSLYTISIPAMPSCGCTNPSYDMNLLGKNYSDTIDICSPMGQLLDILKPILWFFFLIGMLFNFFGRSN